MRLMLCPGNRVRYNDALKTRLYGAARPAGRGCPVPDCAYLHTERKKPGVTLELLHLEYLEQHPTGYRYTRFCDLYRQWLARHRLSMRQEHRAGKKTFVDYAGQKPHLVDPATGGVTDVELFVGVLGASNYPCAEATATQQLPDWLGSHERMFRFFGGVTTALVCDFVPGNKIRVLCPTPLCGDGGRRGTGTQHRAQTRPHNHHRVLSQASSDSSLCQTGLRGNAAEEAVGGSQSWSAASFARRLSSA